jgi:hypothetical protein
MSYEDWLSDNLHAARVAQTTNGGHDYPHLMHLWTAIYEEKKLNVYEDICARRNMLQSQVTTAGAEGSKYTVGSGAEPKKVSGF